MTDSEQMSHGLRPRLQVFQEITKQTLEQEKLNESMHSDEQLSNTTMDESASSKQSNGNESEDEENSSENELVNLAQNILGAC